MYTSVRDQPPSALLPHSVTSKLVLAVSAPGPETTTTNPQLPLSSPSTSSAFTSSTTTPPPYSSSPSTLPNPHQASSASASLSSYLPPTHPLSLPAHNSYPKLENYRSSPLGRTSRGAHHINAPMQRTPYSRETTDISDNELRQILDSENISGLPAPYCLVPNYDGQLPLPPNTLWQHPSSGPSTQSTSGNNNSNTPQQPSTSAAARDSCSSQSSTGGGGADNTSGSRNVFPASTSAGSSSTAAIGPVNGDGTKRRTRTTLTPYQLRVLFRVWERTQYPSSDLRFRLATNLMMTPRNVQIWFQNQRQKTKERAELRRRTHSPSLQSPHQHQFQSQSLQQQRPPRLSQQQNQHLRVHAHVNAHDQQQAAMLRDSGTTGRPGPMSGRRHSPPESPFRYSHVLPPAPPAIPPPLAATAPSSRANMRQPAAMLTPPTLYSHEFSQAQHHQRQLSQQMQPSPFPSHSPLNPHAYTSHAQAYASASRPRATVQQPPAAVMLPPPVRVSQQYHTNHQRHLSHPHTLSPRTVASDAALAGRRPSAIFTSTAAFSGSSQVQQQLTESSDMRMERMTSPQEHPHPILTGAVNQLQPQTSYHNISAAPLKGTDQSKLHSPPLTSSLSSLSMASPPAPTQQEQHTENRRTRLSEILNPIVSPSPTATVIATSVPEEPKTEPATQNNRQQGVPLPSFGDLMANVQKPSELKEEDIKPSFPADKRRPW